MKSRIKGINLMFISPFNMPPALLCLEKDFEYAEELGERIKEYRSVNTLSVKAFKVVSERGDYR